VSEGEGCRALGRLGLELGRLGLELGRLGLKLGRLALRLVLLCSEGATHASRSRALCSWVISAMRLSWLALITDRWAMWMPKLQLSMRVAHPAPAPAPFALPKAVLPTPAPFTAPFAPPPMPGAPFMASKAMPPTPAPCAGPNAPPPMPGAPFLASKAMPPTPAPRAVEEWLRQLHSCFLVLRAVQLDLPLEMLRKGARDLEGDDLAPREVVHGVDEARVAGLLRLVFMVRLTLLDELGHLYGRGVEHDIREWTQRFRLARWRAKFVRRVREAGCK
jgi:hypothetical protein